ncbi:Filamin-A [Echinococcus granulosus]|uniref:Filamin-A n=1 Tax=Echinococcus granulosus TaxID=6210 RepID=W6UY59_ECHGR|nr:Filamin-A [Echinococcus granulosus]EUB63537.1 Filamin-A [Echinococcus granulosus]
MDPPPTALALINRHSFIKHGRREALPKLTNWNFSSSNFVGVDRMLHPPIGWMVLPVRRRLALSQLANCRFMGFQPVCERIAEINQRGKEYEEGYVGSDEEEEMPQAERDLAEDAQWKIFQKNTFTRWANEHLKQAKTSVDDIQTDFSDGIKLIRLVEVLSGKKFAHVNKRPTFRTQKLENVTMVLKFLEEDEGLKLVNIAELTVLYLQDPKGKGPTPKQRILAWANSKMPDRPVKNLTTDWNSGVAIGALVDACAPGLCPDWDTWSPRNPLQNATEAMVAAQEWLDVPLLIRPEEMIDPKVDEKAMMTYLSQFPNAKLKEGAPLRPKINPARVRACGLEETGNTVNSIARFTVDTFAAGRADLEVIILTAGGAAIPCEIVKNEDRNLTYSCSYVPKSEGPYRIIIKYAGKEIPNSPFPVNVEGAPGDPRKVTVSGPGIEANGGNGVGRRTFFNAFTKNAGAGLVSCDVIDPNGRRDTIKPRITHPDENGPFLIEYTPKMEGPHKVEVMFVGQPIPNSPFPVNVGPHGLLFTGDIAMALANLQTAEMLKAQQPAVEKSKPGGPGFKLPTVPAMPSSQAPGPQAVSATFSSSGGTTPSGRTPFQPETVVPQTTPSGQTARLLSNAPAGGAACNPSLAYTTGRGVQDKGIRVNDVAVFQVHTERAGGPAELFVDLKRPDGQVEPVKILKVSEHLYTCSYVPSHPGQYTLAVQYEGEHIRCSPFKIIVGPYKQSKVRAFGPGFLIEGPSSAAIKCVDNGDTSAEVSYEVDLPGEYAIHITCDGEDIQGSPFMAMVDAPSNIDVNRINVFGKGISQTPGDVIKGVSTDFTIDLTHVMPSLTQVAQKKKLTLKDLLLVECNDSLGEIVPTEVFESSIGKFTIKYTPKSIGVITVHMAIDGECLKQSGIRVPVGLDAAVGGIKLSGPGLESAKVKTPTYFTMDLTNISQPANRKNVISETVFHITEEDGVPIIPKVFDNQDGTYRIEYVPPENSTALGISVLVAGSQIAQSPYVVPVNPAFDVSKLKATGLDSKVIANEPQQFKIETFDTAPVDEIPTVIIRPKASPKTIPASVKKAPHGFDVAYTLPQPGEYSVQVAWSKYPVAGPFDVEAVLASQKVSPKGSQPATVGSPPTVPGQPLVPLIAAHNASLLKSGAFKDPIPLHTGTVAPMHIVSPQILTPVKRSTTAGPLQAPIPPKMARPIQEGTLQQMQSSQSSGVQIQGSGEEIPDAQLLGPTVGHLTGRLLRHDEKRMPSEAQLSGPGGQRIAPEQVPQQVAQLVSIPQAMQPSLQQGNYQPDPLLAGPGEYRTPRPPILPQEKEVIIQSNRWPQPGSEEPAGKVTAYGPGLEKAMATIPAEFTVDSSKSTPDPLSVIIEGPQQSMVNCTDNGNQTCGVTFVPPVPGVYTVNVLHNGKKHIQGSPFVIQAYPVGKMDLNVDKIKAYGPGLQPNGVFKDCLLKFIVDAREIDPVGEETVSAIIKDPDGRRSASSVVNRHDGTYLVTYSAAMEGPHTIEVTYGGVQIPGSPFVVDVSAGFDASRVRAYGPGLEPSGPHLMPNLKTEFTVDMSGAGKGGLGLSIEGPADAAINCIDNKDGTCTVEYTPTMAGTHDIHLKFGGVEIPMSPFHVRIQGNADVSKVRCYGHGLEPNKVRASVPATFVADTSLAGNAPIEATFTPAPGVAPVAAAVNPVAGQPGLYECTYVPQAIGPCQVEVTCEGKPIIGSPFTILVRPTTEPEKVRLAGAGIRGPVQASLPSTFTVDATDAGLGDLKLDVMDPVGHSLPISVISITPEQLEQVNTAPIQKGMPQPSDIISGPDSGLLACTYEPFIVGEHKIHVMYAGIEIPESPFVFESLRVGRADLCEIKGDVKPRIAVGDETSVTVDTSRAGPGNLMCRATQVSGGRSIDLPVEVEANDDGTSTAYLLPKEAGPVQVELRYGGQLIPNGKYTQEAVPAEELEVPTTPIEAHYAPVDFHLVVSGKDDHSLQAVVVRPSGVNDQVETKEDKDGTMTVKYQPKERGMHELHVTTVASGSDLRMPLKGSPFKFFVDNAASGNITACGPGLSHGVTGQPAEFTVDMKNAGAGGLSVSVEGPSKVEMSCTESGDGACRVTYYPMVPGEYTINLKFMDKPISGSPYVAKITGEPKKRTQMNMSSMNCVSFEAGIDDISILTATVTSPSGHEEPCVLKKLPNNRMGISFTPKETGEHLVNVYKAGKHIPKSPFKVNVSSEDVGDPTRVRVIWPEGVQPMANQRNEFLVDSKNAGYATLSLSIEGPSKAEIECTDNSDGTCTVAYCPTEPGTYLVNVRYADQHVPGSPFTVHVGGEASQRMVQRIVRSRQAFEATQVGNECALTIRIPGDIREITGEVYSSSGRHIPCDIVPIDDERISIHFVPQERGIHTVSILNRGVHVPGSPFQLTVGQPVEGGPSKVRVSGRGLEYGEVNKPNEFSIYTHEAGAGGLSIAIEGPSKAEISFKDHQDGSCSVYYKVRRPGEYICSIKFADEHIPFSPFRIFVTDPKEGGRSETYEVPIHFTTNDRVSRKSETNQLVGPVAFTVHCPDVDHVLEATVESPLKMVERATVHKLDGDQHVVRFVPRESGAHFVRVYLVPENEAHLGARAPHAKEIDGSPFHIAVGDSMADPSTVYATGDGLAHGSVGVKNKFFVNTANAGRGLLSVVVDGPSKVQITCEERPDGYEFSYIPTLPGDYKINIKYGGNFDIFGSPFTARITGSPMGDIMQQGSIEPTTIVLDTATKTMSSRTYEATSVISKGIAQNVKCSGLGLKRGFVGKENQFFVDASKAGNAMLLAGMMGTVHPCERFEIVHTGNNRFSVTYRVEEVGQYWLSIMWGNQHIPGSPFRVEISP